MITIEKILNETMEFVRPEHFVDFAKENGVGFKWKKPGVFKAGNCVYGLFGARINIGKAYRYDFGLINHELFHSRGTLWEQRVRSIKVFWSKSARLEEEAKAFAIQALTYELMGFNPVFYNVKELSKRLANGYKLKLSLSSARFAIERETAKFILQQGIKK
jgi:hypothetical protein